MDDHITLQYDLSTLPTAQHKAGLAGLVLSIQEMSHPDRQRGDNALDPTTDIPILSKLTASSVEISLTETSCQALFDDCYRAIMGTVEVEKAWKKVEVLKTYEVEKKDAKTGKAKVVTMHVHPYLEPRNPFMARHLFRPLNESKSDLWYKLWRDMLWQIPRAKPKTRNPYKETVEGSCNEGAKYWKQLKMFAKAREKNEVRAIRLSSALLLGAQDSTAENVDFSERVDHILALNFWPLTSVIYVPFVLKLDAAKPFRSQMEATGFSLAIPEVCNLEQFCSRFTGVLEGLRTNADPQGYRPKNACVELASEGALDLLTQQAWIVSEKMKAIQLSSVINSVEYIHLEKDGNNVKTLASGMVAPDPQLLRRYQQIHKRYRSPLFRSIRLSSLLDRVKRSWWRCFEKTLNTLPHEFFMAAPDLPYFLRSFRQDVRTAFAEESPATYSNDNKGTDMAEDTVKASTSNASERKEKSIEQIVLNMVRSYLIRKTESKTKVDYSAIKAEIDKQKKAAGEKPKNSSEKNRFEESRAKLSSRLFLEVRSRHGSDFAAYFAEHFGAIQQHTIASSNDFQEVCDRLLKSPQDVRVITLLALSANS